MRRLVLAGALALLAWPATARADVVVTTIEDGDRGECQVGDCTLREAVNHSAAGETITVPQGTYHLDGHLDVTHDMTIAGAGAATTTIRGADVDRVFDIASGASVAVQGVTVTNGDAGDDNGGGFRVAVGAELRLSDAAVAGNGGWQGGGIASGGILRIDRTTVADNAAADSGGGIYTTSSGSLEIVDSTVAGNHADGGGASGDGGGVYVLAGESSFVNSTFSGNTAVGSGGAMWVGNQLELTNVTVADNQATTGGGIELLVDTQRVAAANDIFVRNGGGSCGGITGQIDTTFTLTDDPSCNASGDPSNHQVTDPRLGTLGDNGGPTQTLLPHFGSEAIDNGDAAACPAADQRGQPRPAGGGCDIGSVEVAPPGTLRVITQVSGGDWIAEDFTTRVDGDEAGAQPGSDTGFDYELPPGDYTLSVDGARGYKPSFDCNDGHVTVHTDTTTTCTLTMTAQPPSGVGLVLESYAPTRTDAFYGLNESYLTQTLGYLRDPASFGPAGTVHTAWNVAPGIRAANDRTLAGVDVFFTGWVPSSTYTPEEKSALFDFVRDGGTLIATTDDSGHSMVDRFGLTQADDSSANAPRQNVITDPDHAIANGAFGAVSSYLQYFSTGNYSSLGPNAHEIGRYASGPGTTLAVIEPGALGPGSGAAIFVADVDVLSDFGGATANRTLVKNLFAFAAGEQARPSLSIDDVRQAEGSAGTTPFTFTVRLSKSSPSALTVHYATADGSATAPSDYAAASGDLTFGPGETAKQVTVAVAGDVDAEADEQFSVALSGASSGRIADGQGIGTIVNDDAAQSSPAPAPVIHESVVAGPASGTVKVKVKGSTTFVVLKPGQQIPLGSVIDTRKGRVTLVAAADGSGGTATADFYDGLFRVGQTKGKKPITELTLVEKLTCSAKKASAAKKKVRKRRLWGDGKGHFRTEGKHSAATVVGTKWLVQDTCSSTLTKVARGIVSVRDFAKKKTVKVKAGHQYVARARTH
jgi:CSLREA domain-containing protein